MNYRIAGKNDIVELIKLKLAFLNELTNNENIPNQHTVASELEKYLNTHLEGNDFINWLAVDEEKIIATGDICFHQYPPGYEDITGKRGYILNVYTLPAYRRKGLAIEIVKRLVKEAEDRDIRLVVLRTTKIAQSIYEKFGFKIKDNVMTFGLGKDRLI